MLLIDDHAWTRRLVRSLLEAEGLAVSEAARAKDAIPEAQAARPDLVLLDLLLPDGNGFDLLAPLRASVGPGVPILAFTGLVTGADETRLATAGFDDVIAKPIDPPRLVNSVKAHLPTSASFAPPAGRGTRLLLVDDDATQRRLWALRLGQAGFEVISASDGHAALHAAREHHPHLIVSDVLMPGIDGFELCSRVRADPDLAAIPVVLLTNSDLEPEDCALAQRVGADAYLARAHDVHETIPELRRIANGRVRSNRPAPPSAEGAPDHAGRLARQLDRQLSRNAVLAQRTAALSARLAVLGGLTSVLAETGDVERAVDTALHACLDLGGIAWGGVVVRSGSRWVRRSIGEARTDVESSAEQLMAQLAASADLRTPLRVTSASVGIEGGEAVVVPVVHRDELLGAIVLHATEALDDQRVDFAEVVAGQLALVLALARTFQQLENVSQTERARAHLLESILDAIGDPILVLDRNAKLTRANEAARELVAQIGELPGPAWPERLDLRLDGQVTTCGWQDLSMARALGGEPADGVISTRAEGNQRRWVAVTSRPVEGDAGEIAGAVAVLRDVTQEREAQVRQITNDRLASVGVLAAGIAHEINNPMTTVVAEIELALEDIGQTGKGAGRLRTALDAARRVRTIVADLRTLSREAPRDEIVPVDVSHALDAALRISHAATRAVATVHTTIEDVPIAMGSESRLVQVFVNLIVNAAQAIAETGRHGEIRVRASSGRSGGAQITICDDGPGMTPDTLRRVFTPFFTTKPVGTGTGLGLSISQRIVADAGGTIECESTLGAGTTFTVWLARAPLGAEPPRVSSPSPPSARRRRLLVVDRDPLVRHGIARALRGDHEVVVTDAAESAWARLEDGERFDLVLCEARAGDSRTGGGWPWLLARRPEVASRLVLLTSRDGDGIDPQFPRLPKPVDASAVRALIQSRAWTPQGDGPDEVRNDHG